MQKLSEEAKRNKLNYINEYRKKNFKRFSCDLKIEEMEKVNKVLNEKGINKAEFVRAAFENIDKIL